jgi:hypothetical protein
MKKIRKTAGSVGQILILLIGMVCFAGLIGIFNGGLVEAVNPATYVAPAKGLSLEGATEYFFKTAGEATVNGKPVTINKFGLGASEGGGYFVQSIASAAAWAGVAYMGAEIIGSLLGLEDGEQEALSLASAGGFGSARLAYSIARSGFMGVAETGFGGGGVSNFFHSAGGIGLTVGVLVAAYLFYDNYKKESTKTITFTCEAWDAPVGGSHCEKCNKQKGGLPCSEYQCRSLGQSCQLLNPGTGEENCAWVNRNDVNPPVITLREDALTDGYEYEPSAASHPEDRGVKIGLEGSTSGCIKAFTPLTFGIRTNEPAKCKVDYSRTSKMEEMQHFFGGSGIFKYNHTQIMSLPGSTIVNDSGESLEIQNDGQYDLYVRCADSNGNENVGNFVFKFCVEKGPDTTPPLIVTTDFLNGAPIPYNQSSINLKLFANEVSECKWSHLDEDFDEMPNDFACSKRADSFNAQLLYECDTILDGMKDREENKFYFRCKDQPNAREEDRNTNSESYEFTLIGTQPLIIDEVGPNETVKDASIPVKVTLTAETSAGHDEGKAICSYSEEGDGNYIQFFNTNSHEHSQDLYLPEKEEGEEDYTYYIKCVDLGGNYEIEKVEFKVESDAEAPQIVRAYHEESYLKFVTNEEAECVYSLDSCNFIFDDGVKVTTVEETDHFIDWETEKTLYVKCRDEFGNEPVSESSQAKCSIVVRAFEDYSDEEEE